MIATAPSPLSLLRRVGRKLLDFEDAAFERLHGLETRGRVWSPTVGAGYQAAVAHARRYEPTRLRIVRRLLQECFRSGARPTTFIDLGCGKGKACFYAAATRRFQRVVGVEYSAELLDAARRNLARFGEAPIEFVCEDAGQFRMPEHQSVVFMYNPFDAHILGKFLDLNEGLLSSTRSLIAYHNDHHRDVIVERGYHLLFREPLRSISLYRAN